MIQPKILYALTTYDAYAYVDLSITLHKKFGNEIIVIDDGSCSQKLHDVCIKHNVPLLSICRRYENKYGIGDIISTVEAISYAYFHGYTHVVKQSRRWVCTENPTPSLVSLIKQSQGSTFSNNTTSYGFGFRTQLCAYETKTWINVIKQIYKDLKNKKHIPLVEHYIHVLAENNQPDNQVYKKYIEDHPSPKDQSGYVHWIWMGDDKKNPPNYIIWHDKHGLQAYLDASNKEGLTYNINDFKV